MTIVEISTALSSIKTAMDIAKIIKEVDKDLKIAEIKMQIVDLMDALVESRGKIQDVQILVQDKDDQIQSLLRELEISKATTFRTPFYYLSKDGSEDGPFCQCCFDKEKKLSRPIQSRAAPGSWVCNVCKTSYHDQNYRPPSARPMPTENRW